MGGEYREQCCSIQGSLFRGMQAIVETLFDAVYLCTVLTIGIRMIAKNQNSQYRLFGIMAVVLGLGDSFHLMPRALERV